MQVVHEQVGKDKKKSEPMKVVDDGKEERLEPFMVEENKESPKEAVAQPSDQEEIAEEEVVEETEELEAAEEQEEVSNKKDKNNRLTLKNEQIQLIKDNVKFDIYSIEKLNKNTKLNEKYNYKYAEITYINDIDYNQFDDILVPFYFLYQYEITNEKKTTKFDDVGKYFEPSEQTKYVKDNFTLDIMSEQFEEIINSNIPESVKLKLPKLKLPKLEKVNE